MADAEEKARQEKIAAARKRVEEMKKRRNMQSGQSAKPEPQDAGPAPGDEAQDKPPSAVVDGPDGDASPSPTQSLAQQSKIRSTSFRAGSGSGPVSPAPFSPDGDTAPDIYRKHVARIEELEKENKRLAKEAADAERRWKKAEDALSDLREADGDNGQARGEPDKDERTEKLEDEIASLQRQNAQLQQQVSRGGHGHHRPSVSSASPSTELQAELEAKTATIESMEIEM
ncbi:hypothetical protein CDD83_1642 [Cordyceps sp. RAO-2017]|nr:hypothetical protein CDD83_1642 [Cordyceps sp. RAO-2017]